MFRIPDSKSNHWFTSSHELGCLKHSHGNCCHRHEGKTVNSVGQDPAKTVSLIARQQELLTSAEPQDVICHQTTLSLGRCGLGTRQLQLVTMST